MSESACFCGKTAVATVMQGKKILRCSDGHETSVPWEVDVAQNDRSTSRSTGHTQSRLPDSPGGGSTTIFTPSKGSKG